MNDNWPLAVICFVCIATSQAVPVFAQCEGSPEDPIPKCDCANQDHCCTVLLLGNGGTGPAFIYAKCYELQMPHYECEYPAKYEVDVQWCDYARPECLEIDPDCKPCKWTLGFWSDPELVNDCPGGCYHNYPGDTGSFDFKCTYEE